MVDPDKSPDHYYQECLLLFWTIIAVAARRYTKKPSLLRSLTTPLNRLLWATVGEVPQKYYVVKALGILCVWPLPVRTTSQDQTFMLSGLMLQIAMQIGLHRPSPAQDFSRIRFEMREEELRDRTTTWAAWNVIAQRVATGYGEPPTTVYDWTLSPSGTKEVGYRLPGAMDSRLRIEVFCDKTTRALYNNPSDPVGLADEASKTVLVGVLNRDLQELEQRLGHEDLGTSDC